VIGETLLGDGAEDVLRHADELSPQDRLEYLASWVLPSADHPVFRLHGAFSPSNPALLEDQPATRAAPRTVRGGDLRAPAVVLVDTARALGKLDELAARIDRAEPEAQGDSDRRGKLALEAVIAIAREDDARAGGCLDRLKPLLEAVPRDDPERSRWPELVAASQSIGRPALRARAIALLETMAAQSRKSPAGKTWQTQVNHVLARGRLLAEGAEFGVDPGIAHWASAIQPRADTRGTGAPAPYWTYRDGQFTHFPGHALDMLYLSVPLRGDFQLDCELNMFDGNELRVSYGGMAVGPKSDLKHVLRTQYGRALPEIAINPPLERPDDWYAYRLVVKGGTMTSFVGGKPIHQAALPAECDPWLALCADGPIAGSARNLKISGRPAIPRQLDLSAPPDLTGWRADEYGESVTGDAPDWSKRGDEIFGRRRDAPPANKEESLLRYHRPLLEDGAIAYEFYYEPSVAMAHPAIDRLVFILESDGVRLHRLTDAQYERGGLAPDNLAVEAGCRRGLASLPLKPKAWNRAVVALTGDTVSLHLNGELIYERPLEPTNQRSFGFFHYAAETEARVRNVTYRGDWPAALPAGPGG
jgi:hypothetical protein